MPSELPPGASLIYIFSMNSSKDLEFNQRLQNLLWGQVKSLSVQRKVSRGIPQGSAPQSIL